MSDRSPSDFFVGYLPVPIRLKRFAWASGVALLAATLGSALVFARSTHGASRGHFAFAQSQGVLGVISARPTPVFWTIDPAAVSGVRGTLLARQGKFGLGTKAAELDGHAVRIDGTAIERDGHRMIELGAPPVLADDALPEADRARILARAQTPIGETTVVGEIVDSKCYLGRMRPGDQRTHRACAQQCIAGGIPPLLVAHDEHGNEQQYLLADREGNAIADAILPFVAEPIRVTGELMHEGDLSILRTDLEHIVRL